MLNTDTGFDLLPKQYRMCLEYRSKLKPSKALFRTVFSEVQPHDLQKKRTEGCRWGSKEGSLGEQVSELNFSHVALGMLYPT